MRTRIQEGLSELSSKEYLELQKSKSKMKHDDLINRGVRGLLKDSLDRTDEILDALSNTGDINFEYRKLEILDSKDRTSEADNVLSLIQSMDKSEKEANDFADYISIRNLVFNWKQN